MVTREMIDSAPTGEGEWWVPPEVWVEKWRLATLYNAPCCTISHYRFLLILMCI